MPTYSQMVNEFNDIQNSIRSGTEIPLSMTKIPSDEIMEGLNKLRIRVWETQDRIGIVQYGDSSEESRTWLSQIEDNGKKKHRVESTN